MRMLLPLLLLLPGGCGSGQPATIDSSSPSAFQQSVERAREDLPVRDRLDFDRAMATVGARRHAARDPEALARTTFDGMTAQQIVADYRSRH